MSEDLALAFKKYKNKGKNVWKGNEDIKKRVQFVLKKYERIIYSHIYSQIDKGWEISNRHNDEFASKYLKGLSLSDEQKKPYYHRNLIAREAMKHRKDDGVSLSKRVWKLTKQTQAQLDTFLLNGLADGRSAKDLQKDIRKYLKEPDKQFRRVRDEKGKLVLSEPGKNYHPGRGVYRSSYKNALRLTRNEINIAYRTADHERRMAMDFVLGIEVKLSPSHKIYDICDEMKGKYPKNFKFTGWHPNCLCYTKSILMDKKDFVKFLKTKNASGYITGIPSNAKNYISDNHGKIKAMATTPYFFRDNEKFFKKPDNGLRKRYKGVDFKTLHKGKNGGIVEVFTKGKQYKHEFAKNKNTLRLLSEEGYKFRLLPVIEDGYKNPDAYNLERKKYADIKVAEGTNGKNIIQGAIKEASKQKVEELLIHIKNNPKSYRDLYIGLKNQIQGKRCGKLETIVAIFPNGEIKEYNISKLIRKITKR